MWPYKLWDATELSNVFKFPVVTIIGFPGGGPFQRKVPSPSPLVSHTSISQALISLVPPSVLYLSLFYITLYTVLTALLSNIVFCTYHTHTHTETLLTPPFFTTLHLFFFFYKDSTFKTIELNWTALICSLIYFNTQFLSAYWCKHGSR